MNFIQQIERLQRLIKLIEQENTGTPDELASRLHLSKRQLHNQLESLKNLGANIEYSKKVNSYKFKTNRLDLRFSLTLIEGEELTTIYGGNHDFSTDFLEKHLLKVLSAI